MTSNTMPTWRAEHIPGRRLLMMGHDCAAVVPAESAAEMLELLWPMMQTTPEPVALMTAITQAGLSGLTDFVLLVRDADVVRCVVRGDVRVSDLTDSTVLAQGEGLLTWQEATVTSPCVAVTRGGSVRASEAGFVPLVLGCAMVDEVHLSFDGLWPDRGQSVIDEVAPQPLVSEPDPEPVVVADATPEAESSQPVPGGEVTIQMPSAPAAVALLNASHGESVPLVGQVIIGRAPSTDGHPATARLMSVPSPNQDVSRTHLLVAAMPWGIGVTDLNSTNGTMLARTDGDIVTLEPGRCVPVDFGDVLDLGDGVLIRITEPG